MRVPLLPLLLSACSSEDTAKRQEEHVWSTTCPPNFEAILYPDGTFAEAGDGRGRWATEENALRLQVLKRPSVEFMSLYTELMSLDEDGLLPFVSDRTVEAERGGLMKWFYRCS